MATPQGLLLAGSVRPLCEATPEDAPWAAHLVVPPLDGGFAQQACGGPVDLHGSLRVHAVPRL